MFEQPRYIQNNFNIVFPRVTDIRRKAFDLENRLKKEYGPPQVISLPDELDPQLPRVVFDSRSGYSQIIVSQISISLNIVYSADFQTDRQKRLDYLHQRAPILFTLFEILEGVSPYFSGLSTTVNIPSQRPVSDVLAHLASVFLNVNMGINVHDLQVKTTNVVEETFFSNVAVENYRTWSADIFKPGIVQLSQNKIIETGISIVGDFNDRHAFNENVNYRTSDQTTDKLIVLAYQMIDTVVDKVMEV